MKIGIVNDSAIAVESMKRVLAQNSELVLAWVAIDGREAVAKCLQQRPDLVLMDLIMPEMDGVAATAAIMKKAPCAILVVTSSVAEHQAQVFEAMGAGALDAVSTPVFSPTGGLTGKNELLEKILKIRRLVSSGPPKGSPLGKQHPAYAVLPQLVALGCSTGGPKALAEILAELPPTLAAAVVIVQHIDQQFAPGLAEWLRLKSPLPIDIARDGDELIAGRAYLAGTNEHLVVGRDQRLHYTAEPRESLFSPSVDVFFLSLRDNWPKPGVGAILTGMGRDGDKGMAALRKSGWHTIAQDEKSSIVFGMPKMAIELNGVVEVLPLSNIGRGIRTRIESIKNGHA